MPVQLRDQNWILNGLNGKTTLDIKSNSGLRSTRPQRMEISGSWFALPVTATEPAENNPLRFLLLICGENAHCVFYPRLTNEKMYNKYCGNLLLGNALMSFFLLTLTHWTERQGPSNGHQLGWAFLI